MTKQRLSLTIWLLLVSLVVSYGQSGLKISTYQQILSAQGNSFIQIVITNYNGLGYNTNFIIQASNLLNLVNFTPATNEIIRQINSQTNTVVGTNIIYTPTPWLGASNTVILNNGYQTYVASTAVSLTNLTLTSQWASILISNSLATSITGYCTIPNIRFIGTQSTNALIIPSGKIGIWSLLCVAGMTNCVNNVQQ